jgi:hypothetical protein
MPIAQAMSGSQVMHPQKTVNLKTRNETIFDGIDKRSGSSENVFFRPEARITEKPQKVQ